MQKSKSEIRRLINSNIDAWGQKPKFLTLTFADNVTDVKTANYEFKKFRQRLEYHFDLKLKYVVVVEFQKRGAVHYHVVLFNLPYIKNTELSAIWGNGFIKINKITEVDNIGAYVTKYMTKEDYETNKTDKLVGQKSYFSSRGLMKPEEVLDKKEIDRVRDDLSPFKVYESTFENEYLGSINYTQYNTNRVQKKSD